MENNVILKFDKENIILGFNLSNPNISKLVSDIIDNHLSVTTENFSIDAEDSIKSVVDLEELKSIILEVHTSYNEEIENFYNNTKNDIKTYCSDDDIYTEICLQINEDMEKENIFKEESLVDKE